MLHKDAEAAAPAPTMTLSVAVTNNRLKTTFIAAGLLVILLSLLGLFDLSRTTPARVPYTVYEPSTPSTDHGDAQKRPGEAVEKEGEWRPGTGNGDISHKLTPEQHQASKENMRVEHLEIFSNMTSTGSLFMIDFLGQEGYNPSILPHPTKDETWIVIAMRDKRKDESDIWNAELYCEAIFVKTDNVMRCLRTPLILPIASTTSPVCKDDAKWSLSFMNRIIGPHDARIFWGPERPYIIYGSQSRKSCLGQYIQDLRRVVDWDRDDQATSENETAFFWPTDLQRPDPIEPLEKNWFAFWSQEGEMYLHYDIDTTHRSFAKVNETDGSVVGKDLAPLARDRQCMERLMPTLNQNDLEWMHQATNSLSLTLCKRSDETCHATPENTYILTFFQKKTFYYHGVYEPYVMLFHETSPFAIYAISQKPIWYHGRGTPDEDWRRPGNEWKPVDQSEMIFTMSVNWKARGMRYHGFLDDEVIISFGIEDQQAGGIDVVVGELVRDMGLCD
ncbi:Hypothetical predicted protein [Lecanosticta acicola]|uniref:Uncharacterized protein n=1 Tax=Lecanosticta acicola TaxID=111012 RepID=A0AAI8Z652_9PEZI|nr:Hypothetical predicted protein [Lecanosticta acicola]